MVSLLVSLVAAHYIIMWIYLPIAWTVPGAPLHNDIVSRGLLFSILFLATIGPIIYVFAQCLVIILPIFVVMVITMDVQWLRWKLGWGKAARDAVKDDVELVNR
jgi:hypothetical protein